jgi:hypothetical protein
MGERRGAYRILVEKSEGKISLGIPKHRWNNNIKMDHQEVEWGEWTGLFWLRIGTMAGACKCCNEPSGSIKCEKFLRYLRTY